MTGREALARLRQAAGDGRLDALCERHRVVILTVFGSALDDEVAAPGDLDVAVKFAGGARPDVLGLLDDLAELCAFSDIDLMDLDRADPVARTVGLVDCEPLYESEPYLFAREQLRAIQERLDTAWLRELELRRLAGLTDAPR